MEQPVEETQLALGFYTDIMDVGRELFPCVENPSRYSVCGQVKCPVISKSYISQLSGGVLFCTYQVIHLLVGNTSNPDPKWASSCNEIILFPKGV